MSQARRYAAFLSYSHRDARWAAWLQRQLETYRVPSRLVGRAGEHGPVPARLAPVFRDRDELASASDLGERIESALAASDALVVLCSPASAASRWVNEEVRSYRRLGRGARIHCLVVDGEPDAPPAFPPALTEALGPGDTPLAEPIAADLRPGADGRVLALHKLLAGLLGIGLDELRQREVQRRQRRLAWISAASVAGMTGALVLAGLAVVARNDAQRRQAQAEDLLGFMVDDLRPKLESLGRLDLLDDVGDKATAYFDSLDARDLTDTALSQQARSLTQIGQVRLGQGDHAQAMAAFTGAHARAAELAQRAPTDGQRRYDLAQAEFWIGLVAWQQGRLDEAETWLRRYRDSALALVALDPANFDWQREVAYGYHNLAVLEEGRGRYDVARQAFEDELALYRRWLPEHPDDALLQSEAGNVASWLGTVNELQGRLAEAEAYFAEAEAATARNQAREPEVMRWTDERVNTQVLLAKVRARQGKLDAARDGLLAAGEATARLLAHDPSNHEWRKSHGNTLLSLALVEWARGGDSDAPLDAALPLLAQALAAEPKDRLALRYFTRAELLDAERHLARGQLAAARAIQDRLLARLDSAWQANQSEPLRVLFAQALQLGAALAEAEGDAAAARAQRRAAEARLTEDGTNPLPFGRLETLVQLRQALGEPERAEAPLSRLRAAGHVLAAAPGTPTPAAPAASPRTPP